MPGASRHPVGTVKPTVTELSNGLGTRRDTEGRPHRNPRRRRHAIRPTRSSARPFRHGNSERPLLKTSGHPWETPRTHFFTARRTPPSTSGSRARARAWRGRGPPLLRSARRAVCPVACGWARSPGNRAAPLGPHARLLMEGPAHGGLGDVEPTSSARRFLRLILPHARKSYRRKSDSWRRSLHDDPEPSDPATNRSTRAAAGAAAGRRRASHGPAGRPPPKLGPSRTCTAPPS